MIVRIINVYVKEERIDEFKDATIINHNGSLSEPGVLRFDVLQDSNDRSHFVLYEVYKSESATEQHKLTVHYSKWKSTVESMMSKQRESVSFSAVAPTEETMWQS
jgi:(4S)-4-hydroxy-5-phosphonooxypentane-2,3-dione isomerase